MAITLTPNTVNLFTTNIDTDVVGLNQPSGSNGLEKISQGNETGFYLWTKQTVTIWFYYDNTGWQEHTTILDSDEKFNDGFIEGGMIPWIDHESHGNVQKVYFQTSDANTEVRLFSTTNNVQVDYIPGDNAFDRRFVSINGDTQVAGGFTNDKAGYIRVDHDLENYNPGDTYSTSITIGDADEVISLMDRFKNLKPTWNYDANTGETSIEFIVPKVKNARSTFHSYISLTTIQQGSGGLADPIQGTHTGMSITVRVGNIDFGNGSLQIALPTKGSYKVDWGDGATDDFVNSNDWAMHTYATAGDYQIKIADTSDFQWVSGILNEDANNYWFIGGAGINSKTYSVSSDTNNEGPIALDKYSELVNGSTVDSWTTSGSVMTIVDSSGFRWDQFYTGVNRAGVGTVSVNIDGWQNFEYAPVQSATYDASTKTSIITIAYGKPTCQMGNTTSILMESVDLGQKILANTRVYYGPSNLSSFPTWGPGTLWDRVNNIPKSISRDHGKFISIDQWGDVHWIRTKGAFRGYKNLVINAIDSPDWSHSNSHVDVFSGCQSLTDNNNSLNNANVCHSGIVSLIRMFKGCNLFNSPLNNWNTSGSVSFHSMFRDATEFNGDISTWQFSNKYETTLDDNHLIELSSMFLNAENFNQNINTKLRTDGQLAWDTKNVVSMDYIFRNAYLFNTSISKWNTSKVKKGYGMFRGHHGIMSYNQPLNTSIVTVGSNTYTAWDVSQYDSFAYMFDNCEDFNQPLSNWDTSGSLGLGYMFYKAKKFNQSLDTQQVTVGSNTYTAWDVSNVTTTVSMFRLAYRFNQTLSNWVTSSLTDTSYMFSKAISFNQPLNHFIMQNNTTLKWMFRGAVSFNQPLSNWNVGSVTNGERTFEYAASFNQDLSNWGNGDGVQYMTTTSRMFANMQSMTYGDFTTWNLSNVTSIGMMFGCDGLQVTTHMGFGSGGFIEQVLGPHSFSKGSSVSYNGTDIICSPIAPIVSNWYLPNCTSIEGTFRNQLPTWDQDFSGWNIPLVSNMEKTFYKSYGFVGNGLSNWDVSKVTDFGSCFHSNSISNEDLSTWDVSSCENFGYMFSECSSFIGNGLENWRPISAIYMYGMFEDCLLFNANLSQWTTTSSLKQVQRMFNGTREFNSNLDANPSANIQVNGQSYGTWDVSGVEYFTKFIVQSSAGKFNGTLNNWDVSSTERLYLLIQSPLFQNGSLGTWKNVDKIKSFTLNGVSRFVYPYLLNSTNYDSILIGWATEIQNNGGTSILGTGATLGDVNVNFVDFKYSAAAQSSRDYLTNTIGWNIIDGGLI